jgi:hypothetical protein
MVENLRSLAGAQHFPLGAGDACRSRDACHGVALVRFPATRNGEGSGFSGFFAVSGFLRQRAAEGHK